MNSIYDLKTQYIGFLILIINFEIHYVGQILHVTVKFILKDAEEKKSSFNPRPYFRLFINWLQDLGSLDPLVDGANFQVCILLCSSVITSILITFGPSSLLMSVYFMLQILTSFANAFHSLQPLIVPAFRLLDVLFWFVSFCFVFFFPTPQDGRFFYYLNII